MYTILVVVENKCFSLCISAESILRMNEVLTLLHLFPLRRLWLILVCHIANKTPTMEEFSVGGEIPIIERTYAQDSVKSALNFFFFFLFLFGPNLYCLTHVVYSCL